MERGYVYILPREDEVEESIFTKKIYKNHIEAMMEFSKKNNLNYNFNNVDYNIVPCLVAYKGNIVINTLEDSKSAVIYLPEVVTDRQNDNFCLLVDILKNYNFIGGFKNDQGVFNEIDGIDNIITETNKRNILFNRKDDINVRKKI